MLISKFDKRIKVFADFTKELATLSKCKERKVAAVITDEDLSQIYSIGLNGGPKQLIDCMCHLNTSKYTCVHAEINALVKCRNSDDNKVMFVTLSPCIQCAAAIINAPGSFSTIYYIEKYKDDKGLQLLREAGITAIQLF